MYSKEELKLLVKQPFLTGTYIYGPINKDSDIDICMNRTMAEGLKELLENNNMETEPVYKHEGGLEDDENYSTDSYYFSFGGKTINIIALVTDELIGWYRATRQLSSMPSIVDREKRITAFEKYCFESID